MKRLILAVCVLAAAVCAAGSVAGAAEVTVGHSGWNWGNPQPQGNTLRAIEFAGTRGYAGGDFGTLLRTDDRGRSWTGVATGTTTTFSHISVVDQNTAVAASGCVVRRTDDGGATWTGADVNCDSGITSISFPSAQTGYLVLSNGGLYRTGTDITKFETGGAIPGTEAAGVADSPNAATDVFFTDANTGFAVTRGSAGGAVYRTTDGGNTWFERTTSPQGLTDVYFANGATGYAVGVANTVLKTTDGGETWEPQSVPDSIPSSDLTSIRCGTPSNCLISIDSGDRVLRTGNGGNSFTAFPPAAQKIYAVSFSSAQQAVAVGEHGTTVLSTNANQGTPSFVAVADQPLTGTLSRLRAPSASLVLAPGTAGRLARSTDGGRTWSMLQVPTSEDLRDVWFVDGNVGFALDAGGELQRTTDGGDGWSEVDTGTGSSKPNAVYAFDASVVVLIGPQGVRRATSAASPNFEVVRGGGVAKAALTDYDRTAGAAVFAYGRKALFSSSDLGLHWRAVRGPVPKPRYQRVDFLTGKLGFALMESGRVFRTRTGGKTWAEIAGTGSSGGFDLAFADARNGWISVPAFGRNSRSGWVLHTSDGGASWRPQLVEPDPLAPRGLVAPDATAAFALGLGAELFYTNSGGAPSSVASSLTLTPRRRVVNRVQRVRLTGKLTPAMPGASVVVFARAVPAGKWRVVSTPAVGADGSFTTSVRVRRTTQVVAQWRGDVAVAGAGSHAVTIRKR